ncbi:unnamed protein product [Brassica oleracea]
MGKARGINSGGGESSLDYLFGSGESVSKPTKPAVNTSFTTTNGAGGRLTTTTTTNTITGDKNKTEEEKKKEMSAGVRGSPNNYLRTEGQNCGNFLTVIIILLSLLIIRIKNVVFIFFCEKQDRPSTKVHAAPGGGSSLGYLFGSGSGK